MPREGEDRHGASPTSFITSPMAAAPRDDGYCWKGGSHALPGWPRQLRCLGCRATRGNKRSGIEARVDWPFTQPYSSTSCRSAQRPRDPDSRAVWATQNFISLPDFLPPRLGGRVSLFLQPPPVGVASGPASPRIAPAWLPRAWSVKQQHGPRPRFRDHVPPASLTRLPQPLCRPWVTSTKKTLFSFFSLFPAGNAPENGPETMKRKIATARREGSPVSLLALGPPCLAMTAIAVRLNPHDLARARASLAGRDCRVAARKRLLASMTGVF